MPSADVKIAPGTSIVVKMPAVSRTLWSTLTLSV
jgi:hypothetical protein